MRKKKPIVDKLLGQVSKQRTNLEKEYYSISSDSRDLSLTNRIVSGNEDFDGLANLEDEEFDYLVEKFYDDTNASTIKVLKGARFIVSNGIDLYPVQEDALRELLAKVVNYNKSLRKSVERMSRLEDVILTLEDLENDLLTAKKDGIVDSSLVDKIALVLKIDKPEEKALLIDQVLEYNLNSYNSLILANTSQKEEVVENKKEPLDKERVKDLFEKYGFDYGSVKQEYIDSLCENGSLENIEGVFKAIRSNHLKLFEEKKKSKLLVQFLLYSSEEIINRVCSIFKENHISSDYYKSYIQIFFESDVKNGEHKKRRYTRKEKDTSSVKEKAIKEDDLGVVGYHRDFLKNVEYLSEHFNVDKQTLIERTCMLLMRTHESLLRHIEELELYDYDIHSDKFPLSALGASKIMDSTDIFIEMGEERYIKEGAPSRLLLTCDRIAERMYAYRVNGLDYHSERRYGGLKNEVTNLCIPCELSEEAIKSSVPRDSEVMLINSKYCQLLDENEPRKISKKTLENPVIKALEESEHKVSDSLYLFEGVSISRRKLLRNFEFLMSTDELTTEERDIEKILLTSAIRGSFVTSEQIEKVDRALNGAITIGGGTNGLSKK